MQHQLSSLMLFVLAGCADFALQPVVPAIPPQLLAQVDQPTLQGDTAGEVSLLIVGLSGALGQANAQLSAIECLYLKWKAASVGDPELECGEGGGI